LSNTRAFLKAVLCGTISGAIPGLMFSWIGLLIFFGDQSWGGLYLFFAPIILAAPVVFTACLLVGLPLTALLVHLGQERDRYYVLTGLLVGASPTSLGFLFPDGLVGFALLGVSGALGGAVSGWVWGRHRDDLKLARSAVDRD
jgi:hypothetical protein